MRSDAPPATNAAGASVDGVDGASDDAASLAYGCGNILPPLCDDGLDGDEEVQLAQLRRSACCFL